MKFVISFVAPEVLGARELFSEQVKHGEEHVRGDFFIDGLELLEVDLDLALEADVKYFEHFM